jgi:hypothetical protein
LLEFITENDIDYLLVKFQRHKGMQLGHSNLDYNVENQEAISKTGGVEVLR